MSASDIAVSARGLSKSYTIAHDQEKHVTLAETMLSRLKNPLRRPKTETFWALKDIEFDIKKGDVVGIIGRNGAGKSTLLKILSRITEPTAGKIDLFGRVGSLLEVGTGFHPELTGRENIFLNGAILGMNKLEIRKQFDAIVDFAGVEQFLDTPVKRYSSGMYVRLAFAVAAHLASDILVVDEVLAVGDADFQRKCLGTMKTISASGRTVAFVSHNMHSISLLCTSGLVLAKGVLTFDGDVDTAIDRYATDNKKSFQPQNGSGAQRPGSGEYRFDRVQSLKATFSPDEPKTIRCQIRHVRSTLGQFYASGILFDERGFEIAQLDGRLVGAWIRDAATRQLDIRIASPWLKPGRYTLDLYLCTASGLVDVFQNASMFEVSDILPYESSAGRTAHVHGLVLADFSWNDNTATTAELHRSPEITC